MPERICDGTCVHQREGRCQLDQDNLFGFQSCPLTRCSNYHSKKNHRPQDSMLP
ncbi:MAG: hypothetical protein ACOY9Y_12845 [Bacillota bacterium]